MNADILKYIFELKKENKSTKEIVTEEELLEETFDYVYENLTFVTRRLYLLCLKVLIVFMYLFITIETFIRNRSDLTEASFPHLLEFLIFRTLVHMRFHFS